MTRAERYEQVAKLRGEGLLLREIAKRLDISISYVGNLLDDPDGSATNARKRKMYGVCEDCGAPTAYKTGGPSPKCRSCTAIVRTIWTKEAVVAAIQRFAERHGRPPHATDFNPHQARNLGHDWRADRFYADGDYPTIDSAQRAFGTWNAAIQAAGFKPSGRGEYPRIKGLSQFSSIGAHLESEAA